MRKFLLIFFPLLLAVPAALAAPAPQLTAVPATVLQGEPALVTLEGVPSAALVKSAAWKGQPVKFFSYASKTSALVAADLKQKPGVYEVRVVLKNGTSLAAPLAVMERPKVEAPLGIPDKLGGNTPESEKALLGSLARENAALAALKSGTKAYWSKTFRFPVKEPVVTDAYGYTRLTGGSTISHKGTDFRAPAGTPVLAMNRGVVRYARTTRTYGKTIVVDHGLGLMTFYMHLSRINVRPGQLVQQGQVIGLSGATGYAEQPHLHLTVRINGISIDPLKFMDLFGLALEPPAAA